MPFEFIATRTDKTWIIHAAVETEVFLRPEAQGPVMTLTLEYDDGAPTREAFSKLGHTIYHALACLMEPRQMHELLILGGVLLNDAAGQLWQRSYPSSMGAMPIRNRT